MVHPALPTWLQWLGRIYLNFVCTVYNGKSKVMLLNVFKENSLCDDQAQPQNKSLLKHKVKGPKLLIIPGTTSHERLWNPKAYSTEA